MLAVALAVVACVVCLVCFIVLLLYRWSLYGIENIYFVVRILCVIDLIFMFVYWCIWGYRF